MPATLQVHLHCKNRTKLLWSSYNLIRRISYSCLRFEHMLIERPPLAMISQHCLLDDGM